jgi:hypothetical protein
MKRKYWLILICVVFLGFALLILRPVPILAEKDCQVLKGTVTDVYEAGVKDVVLTLHGQKKLYYVNRGLERGLDLTTLKQQLINEEVVIKYPDYWTPLDINQRSIHISKIEHNGKTVFTELK